MRINLYKRKHSVDNINKFKKRLSEEKWQEILDNDDANNDYNPFIEQFNKVLVLHGNINEF